MFTWAGRETSIEGKIGRAEMKPFKPGDLVKDIQGNSYHVISQDGMQAFVQNSAGDRLHFHAANLTRKGQSKIESGPRPRADKSERKKTIYDFELYGNPTQLDAP